MIGTRMNAVDKTQRRRNPQARNVSTSYAPPKKFTKNYALKSNMPSIVSCADHATKTIATMISVNFVNKSTPAQAMLKTTTSGSVVTSVTAGYAVSYYRITSSAKKSTETKTSMKSRIKTQLLICA